MKFFKVLTIMAATIGIFVFVTGIADLPSLFGSSDYEDMQGTGVVPELSLSEDSFSTIRIGDRKYKTVKIGNQIWMAENLNLFVEGTVLKTIRDTSYRFYNLKQAFEASNEVKGWHIPTNSEWRQLIDHFGGKMVPHETIKDLEFCESNDVIDKFSSDSLFNLSFVISPEYMHGRTEEAFWSSTIESNFFGLNRVGYTWTISLEGQEKILNNWYLFKGQVNFREVSIPDENGYGYYSLRLIKDS